MLDKTWAYLHGIGVDPSQLELFDAAMEEVKLIRSLPEIVMLAGSSRFKQAFEEEAERLALEGRIVFAKCVFKPGEQWNLSDRQKDMIHAVQFRTMDVSDRLHIVNVDGYIGQDTYNLIRYTLRIGKTVSFREERVRLLHKDGESITTHHFLQGTRRRVEFEEAATGD